MVGLAYTAYTMQMLYWYNIVPVRLSRWLALSSQRHDRGFGVGIWRCFKPLLMPPKTSIARLDPPGRPRLAGHGPPDMLATEPSPVQRVRTDLPGSRETYLINDLSVPLVHRLGPPHTLASRPIPSDQSTAPFPPGYLDGPPLPPTEEVRPLLFRQLVAEAPCLRHGPARRARSRSESHECRRVVSPYLARPRLGLGLGVHIDRGEVDTFSMKFGPFSRCPLDSDISPRRRTFSLPCIPASAGGRAVPQRTRLRGRMCAPRARAEEVRNVYPGGILELLLGCLERGQGVDRGRPPSSRSRFSLRSAD